MGRSVLRHYRVNRAMQTSWTIDGVRKALAAKKISARELAADFYKRIEARNPELNAFLALSPERARRQTDRIDALVAAGKPLPPLAGVAPAGQDVINTRGVKTTRGPENFANLGPPDRSPPSGRVEGVGAGHPGKTNSGRLGRG